MKGLILVAGNGTRMQPLSYTQPKTLLPVANKPVLYYGIENLLGLGIEEIGIVLNPSQDKAIRRKLVEQRPFPANFTFIYQERPQGIADAVGKAERFINGDSFLLLLGDNLIQEPLARLLHTFEKEKANGAILLATVEQPQDYGVAEVTGGRIVSLEEKPRQPKSNLAVIGAYVFDAAIFQAVRAIRPSPRGEFEITDAIQWLIDRRYTIVYTKTEEPYSDVGTIVRWLEANRWMLQRIAGGQTLVAPTSQVTNCRLIPPVIVGDHCKLQDAVIGPYVSIASRARVERCQIKNSIILEGAELRDIPRMIADSVFGRFSRVTGAGRGWEADKYVLGDKATLIVSGEKRPANSGFAPKKGSEPGGEEDTGGMGERG
ncbi:glucose-1-phosphate thymidylyltransferase [Bacillaceae bacterium]